MKVSSAVLLVMFLLVAVGGWFAAAVAGPKVGTLLMGVAIGVIISMPVTLLVARMLWSEHLRTVRRRERRQQRYHPPSTAHYPPVIVVPSRHADELAEMGREYGAQRRPPDPPPIHYLGEE